MNFFTAFNPVDLFHSIKLFNGIRAELFRLIESHDMPYPLDQRFMHAVHGSIKITDAYVIKLLLEKQKPKSILEVGSFLGFSTRWFLEISSRWNAKVTSVDPNIRHRIFDNPKWFLDNLNSEFYPDRLEIQTAFFGDYDHDVYYDYENYEPRRDRSYVDRALGKIANINKSWNRKFDFIFIDGNHTFESVIDNFTNASSLLDDGGCIAFHDVLTWQGVRRALEELKTKYRGEAEISIHGKLDNFILRTFLNRSNDGIGLFRQLNR